MLLVSPESLSAVVGSIYEATYDPTQWAAAIGNLENLFHGSKACFGRFGPDIRANDIVATHIDETFQLRYIEELAHEENGFADAISAAPVGMVYHDHALVGDALKRSRLWNEWMAPQDMYGGLGCKVLEAGSSYWYFDVQRGYGQASFETADAELLRTIVPHLARAAEIRRKFQSAQHLASTFSQLPFGVIVVDGHMRIATVNAAAEAILRRPESGLLAKSGHLVAANAGSKAALQHLVAHACSARDDVIPGVGGDLLIRTKRRGAGADLGISVGPLVNRIEELPFGGRHAAIFIREISLELPAGFREQVRTFFDLTPKEAALAARLASGMTLKEAAADAHISIHTARSYLDSVFLKTGTHQQSQLVALLKSAQPLIRRP
ncbi:LuxR C-terminal-related transcriptional regulator [Roseiarcaceae bacterium H3SJ34-1]|uniref:helix-turn-helix transcriptional regulator n=1 Tax=Terripilifer ovatus TaxID=3032367 RepID=UPI003AB97CB2|nr:LuxR C-terminal-related transcriptional regulator [Roseiarcaceae bacterium H3SJ34-1]